MKKLVALILALTMIVGLCACAKTGGDATKPNDTKSTTDTKPAGENTDGKKPLNIMMYVIQSLGTLSCEDLIYAELTKFCEETGSTLNYYECNSDETKHDTTLPELCAGGEYDVIVTGYYSIPEPVQRAAEMYPDQKWILFDCSVDYSLPQCKNIASFTADQNTLAFMAGALAALMTTETSDPHINADKVVGWVGGGENTAVNDFLVGYIDGVNYVDPSIEVLYSYVGDWTNSAKATELANAQYDMGADVIFAVAGGAGFGACESAAATGHYAFGVDTDFAGQLEQSGSATADYVVSSAIKQFGKVVYDAMVKFYNGELEFGKHTSCDVSSGYLEMLETKQFEKIVKEGMPDVYKRYTEICQDLKDGKIEVGTAVGATPEYVAQKKAEAAAH